MSQISPPLRILLIGSIVFLGAYFAFMRPGGPSETATAPTPAATTVPAKSPGQATQSSPGAAVQSAVTAQNASDAAVEAAAGDGTTAAVPGTASGTATEETGEAATSGGKAPGAVGKSDKQAAKGLPLPVAKAVAANKVLVLLFWNPRAADDRAVRKAVKGIGRHKGQVVVHVANVAAISRYAPMTRGVDVSQSPSVVVVDRKLEAELLTGFSDREAIEQSVSDALRAGRR